MLPVSTEEAVASREAGYEGFKRSEDVHLHPVCSSSESFEHCVALARARKLEEFEFPWPRSQDVAQDFFKLPRPDDFVVAVSHAWPYQAHPDPKGLKARIVMAQLQSISTEMQPKGELLVFYDFLGVSQRPFREGQSERTEEQTQAFRQALAAMPQIYLQADAVLHIDSEWQAVEGDRQTVTLEASDLSDSLLLQLGGNVQVFSHGQEKARLFDILESLDGELVPNNLDVVTVQERLRQAIASNQPCPVTLRRCPMGNANKIPSHDRGWVYLERFVSMVKAAMVPESDFGRVCFSNSPAIGEQIRAGSVRLRRAAIAAGLALQQELEYFFQELDSKQFSAASTDSVSGESPGRAAKSGDRDVVMTIMQAMVRDLPLHWVQEQQRQHQRQLKLAVIGKKVDSVKQLLELRADPNFQGHMGRTSLHIGAASGSVETVKLLVEYAADASIKDSRGNLAAHAMPLFTRPETMQLLDLLCPKAELLAASNNMGVKVGRRFEAWSRMADSGQPYTLARDKAELLSALHPEAFTKHSIANAGMSMVADGMNARRFATTVKIAGLEYPVDTWESCHSEMTTQSHLVCISFAQMPWQLIEEELEAFIQELCARRALKVFVVNEKTIQSSLQPSSPVISHMEILDHLERLVAALPLNEKFALFDLSKFAMAALLVWRLKPRLSAAALCNPFGFISEELMATETVERCRKFCHGNDQKCRAQDPEVFVTRFGDFFYGGVEPEHAARMREKFKEKVYNGFGSTTYGLFAMSISEVFGAAYPAAWKPLPPIEDVPITVFGGDNAGTMIFDSIETLTEKLLPKARVYWIEDSKQWWLLEGQAQRLSVAIALLELMQE